MGRKKANRRRPARKRKRALPQKTSREQPTPESALEDVVSDDVVQVPKPPEPQAPDGKLCRCPKGHPGHVHFKQPDYSHLDYAPHEMRLPSYGSNATAEFRRATGG